MFEKLKAWGRLPDFGDVVRRFPVGVGVMALLTLTFMLDGISGFSLDEDNVPGFVLAAYLCVGIQLAAESRKRLPSWLWVVKATVAAAAIILSTLQDALAFEPFIAVLAAVVFLGNFAFRGRVRDDAQVWLFTQKLWTGAIFAFIGSVVFALGTLAIGETVNALFGLDLSDLNQHLVLPVGLAFLAPVYWLGTLPDPHDAGDALDELSFEARALAFLGVWLLAPLTLIYGLIILAYAVRIGVTRSLPDGDTALLVTPFLVVGTLTWLMLEPKVLKAGGFVRLYRRVWFPIMLVASVLLAVAVAMRVAEYGLTFERNLLIATTVCAMVLAAWFTATRPRTRQWDIRIPTATAAGFLLAAAFLAKPLADINQLMRLREGLAQPDRSTLALQVRESASYLSRRYGADRADWVARELGVGSLDDIGNLRDYLIAQGYDDPDARRERLAREREESSARYALRQPAEVDVYPVFVGRMDVSIDDRMRRYRNVDAASSVWIDEYIYIGIDGRTARLDVGDLLERAYLERARNRREGDPDPDAKPITLRFDLPGGGDYMLVFTELNVFGKGLEPGSGRGEALLFRR